MGLFSKETAVLLSLYQAVFAGDEGELGRQISRLHPAMEGRLACLIQVTIALRQLREMVAYVGSPDAAADASLSMRLQCELLEALSVDYLDQLWRRFAPLDATLQGNDETHVKVFPGPPSAYYFERLPAEVMIERAIVPLVA